MATSCVLLFLGGIGAPEIFLIFLIILLLFGARRLPEIAKAMGKAINEFKRTKDDLMNYDDDGKEMKNINSSSNRESDKLDDEAYKTKPPHSDSD